MPVTLNGVDMENEPKWWGFEALPQIGDHTHRTLGHAARWGIWVTDSAAPGLPADESTTTNLNSWIDICA